MMKNFFEKAANQNHPLRALEVFLEQEYLYEKSKEYEKKRFVGYVLEIDYDTISIITSDPFKISVGGVPRNSFLIMAPANYKDFLPHFTLLRVLESAPTPLSQDVQKTYFELQKKSMPELDIFTQSELQWGALKTSILGMFYSHPENKNTIEFSGDLNNYVSAHKYRIYAPDDELLDLIVNALVAKDNLFSLGKLRMTECRLPLPDKSLPDVTVNVSTNDFIGARTAMFGKTRLGKSNVVKLIAQSIIETTKNDQNVGQLIFDINGEYANDNPQDDELSLASAYKDRCLVYALTPKENTPSKPLKLNFYEQSKSSHRIVGGLLTQDGRDSMYIKNFISTELPSIEEIENTSGFGDKRRAIRKIQIYWAILKKAGFPVNESRLKNEKPSALTTRNFNPGFAEKLRSAAYNDAKMKEIPSNINSLDQLVRELEIINKYRRKNDLKTDSGSPLFDTDDIALLDFLEPSAGMGAPMLQSYRDYHDKNADDFLNEIINLLNSGKTVIVDLGNAHPQVMAYFSDELSKTVFRHQVDKFSNNKLGNNFIQLYFEEAHNLFPKNEDVTTIYSRFAKEGAKYHIGMVYSTQSPSTVNKDLLAQTENFFILHLSSQEEVNVLAKLNVAYDSIKNDILRAKTIGYIRMLTRSHRFVIPIQAKLFTPLQKEGEK